MQEDYANATVEIGWVVLIGKKEKKMKKTFKLDFAGNVDQEMVSKKIFNTLEKKNRLLEKEVCLLKA